MENTLNNITFFAQAAPAAQTTSAQVVPAAPDASAVPGEQAPQGAFGGGAMTIAVYVLLFAGLWFLLFMPQRKRQKELQKLQSELKTGDSVVTTSGIIGKIVSLDEAKATLQVSAGTQITFLRAHIVGKAAE